MVMGRKRLGCASLVRVHPPEGPFSSRSARSGCIIQLYLLCTFSRITYRWSLWLADCTLVVCHYVFRGLVRGSESRTWIYKSIELCTIFSHNQGQTPLDHEGIFDISDDEHLYQLVVATSCLCFIADGFSKASTAALVKRVVCSGTFSKKRLLVCWGVISMCFVWMILVVALLPSSCSSEPDQEVCGSHVRLGQ